MPSAESPSDKIHSVAEVMPQRDSTEGISDSSLNEAPQLIKILDEAVTAFNFGCQPRWPLGERTIRQWYFMKAMHRKIQEALTILRDGQPG